MDDKLPEKGAWLGLRDNVSQWAYYRQMPLCDIVFKQVLLILLASV